MSQQHTSMDSTAASDGLLKDDTTTGNISDAVARNRGNQIGRHGTRSLRSKRGWKIPRLTVETGTRHSDRGATKATIRNQKCLLHYCCCNHTITTHNTTFSYTIETMSSPISSFKAVMEDMKTQPSRNTMEGMIYNGTSCCVCRTNVGLVCVF